MQHFVEEDLKSLERAHNAIDRLQDLEDANPTASTQAQLDALQDSYDALALTLTNADDGSLRFLNSLAARANGDLVLTLDSAAVDVSKALLDAATANAPFVQEYILTLEDANGFPHLWMSSVPVLTPSNAVTSAGNPTLEDSDSARGLPAAVVPVFVAGVSRVRVVFDPGTYGLGETVTVKNQVSATDDLPGTTFQVNAGGLDIVYTVIA